MVFHLSFRLGSRQLLSMPWVGCGDSGAVWCGKSRPSSSLRFPTEQSCATSGGLARNEFSGERRVKFSSICLKLSNLYSSIVSSRVHCAAFFPSQTFSSVAPPSYHKAPMQSTLKELLHSYVSRQLLWGWLTHSASLCELVSYIMEKQSATYYNEKPWESTWLTFIIDLFIHSSFLT